MKPHPPSKIPVPSHSSHGQTSTAYSQNDDVFKKPAFTSPSHSYFVHSNSHSRLDTTANLKLPDHSNANHSPTPSDISSIRMTPHLSSVLTPTLEQRNGVNTPRTPVGSERGHNFLEPFPLTRPDWNAFKVLPSVIGNNPPSQENFDPQHPGSSLSQYPVSNVSLSPFPSFDFSPAPSIFSSPRHSAKSHRQKRALSISPLSADGIDINTIMRTSPTSLIAYINGGSSRASSANRSRLSPFTNTTTHQNIGNQGHLNPRNVLEVKIKEEYANEDHAQMAALEQQGTHHDVISSNQVVMPQNHAQLVEGYMYRQHHNLQHQHQPSQQLAPTNSSNQHQDMLHAHKQEAMQMHHSVQHHHQENPFYHPEQQMPQLTARPPPLPRPGVSVHTSTTESQTTVCN